MEYQSVVKIAEEAVASMKDPKLREVAFAQILAKLLAGDKQAPPHPATPERKATASKASSKPGKKQTGVTVWLRELIAEGFFQSPRSGSVILERLGEQGHHLEMSDISKQVGLLCHSKELRRKKLAPAEGKASVWHYSNW